jgi:hypothetical protein
MIVIAILGIIVCSKDNPTGINDSDDSAELIAHYPFNSNSNDASSNNHNGTVIGATLTTDRFGNENSAYAFDGADDYISITNTAILKTDAISITAWIKINSLAVDWMDIVSYGPLGHVLAVDENGHVIGGLQFSWTCEFECSTYVATEDWFFITLTRDSNHNIKLYVNGSEESSNKCDIANPKYDFNINIGRDPSIGEYFNGDIDEVRIYKGVLTKQEIVDLYM